VRKGGATRRKVGRSFVYAPALSRDVLRRLAIEELVNSFFNGSREELAAYLEGRAAERISAAAPVESGALETALL